MRLAGQYGDGLITDPRTWKQYKSEWEGGARDAGKNPADMPVLVEQFVVVGDKNEAQQAAQFWRFLPKAFKKYYNVADPAEIQQHAEGEVPLDKIIGEWPVGTDPAIHIAAINRLGLAYVVIRSWPFHRTTALGAKSRPLSIRVKAGSEALAVLGEPKPIEGVGLGPDKGVIGRTIWLETPPPGAGRRIPRSSI